MITLVPRTFLWPSVFILAMIGAYAYRQTSFDVWVMLISGLIGFFALRHGFGPAPFVMGFVLGGQIEKSWSQSMIIFDSKWLRFFDSPICLVFSALTASRSAGPAIWPPLGRTLQRKMSKYSPHKSPLAEMAGTR